jgi:hypothetical protein
MIAGQEDSAAALGIGAVNNARAAMNAKFDRASMISSLPSFPSPTPTSCASLDAVAAINSIDKAARIQFSHQLIINNILNLDARKARIPRL